MTKNPSAPVVCGYDGSDNAGRAVGWAARWAVAHDTGLKVISADKAVGRVIAFDSDARENVHNKLLAEITPHVEDTGVDLTIDIVAASPTAALVEASESATAVIVGSRGLGRREDLVMGSVSAAVVEHAKCPVLVVTPDTPDPDVSGGVLLAADGSENAAPATDFAFAEAERRGSKLTALHVVETARVGFFRSAEPSEEDIAADREQVTSALAGQSSRFPGVDVEVDVRSGDAADVIVDASLDSALLVMGSRGHGGFAGLLLGSVSRRVIQRAACAVAIVRS